MTRALRYFHRSHFKQNLDVVQMQAKTSFNMFSINFCWWAEVRGMQRRQKSNVRQRGSIVLNCELSFVQLKWVNCQLTAILFFKCFSHIFVTPGTYNNHSCDTGLYTASESVLNKFQQPIWSGFTHSDGRFRDEVYNRGGGGQTEGARSWQGSIGEGVEFFNICILDPLMRIHKTTVVLPQI